MKRGLGKRSRIRFSSAVARPYFYTASHHVEARLVFSASWPEFAELDEAVTAFHKAAEGFAELWIEATIPRYVMPQDEVQTQTILDRLTVFLGASKKLLEAVNHLPQKVQEALRRWEPPPGLVLVYYPPMPLPQRAEEVIRFARVWISRMEKPEFWSQAWDYDFFYHVWKFLQYVWEDWARAWEHYQALKKKIQRDCLLYGKATWFGDEESEKSESTPATVVVSVTEATEGLRDLNAKLPTEGPKTPDPTAAFVFRRDGDGWFIRAYGAEGHFSDMVGFRYIHTLLNAQEPVPTFRLISGPEAVVAAPLGGDPVLDDRAKDELRKRIEELNEEIEEARRFNDIGRVEHLQSEQMQLLDRLNDATAIQNRDRRLGDENDKIRSKVAHAIKRVRERLAESGLKELADHLKVSITVGTDSSYSPPKQRPDWLVS